MIGGANYGNCLQNYAVQTTLEKMGFETYTLNNTTKRGFQIPATPDLPLIKKLAPSYVKQYLQTRQCYRCGAKNDRDFHGAGHKVAKAQVEQWRVACDLRQQHFDEFRARVIKTDLTPMDNVRWDKKHLSEYFAFVTGSDQVWNPFFHTTSCIDFLQFAPQYKRVCFAPSFGISEIPEARRKIYEEWLSEIPYLSVREEAGARIIKDLTGHDAAVLMDPTFCVSAEEWRAFATEPQGEIALAAKPKRPFVLCYFLGNMNKAYTKWIEAYAAQAGLEVVYLWDVQHFEYYAVNPQEFVWFVDNARAVFTDSFHGAALSINLEKPFVVFPRDEGGHSMGSRLQTLLAKTGLEERLWRAGYEASDVHTIDFSGARQVVEIERKKTSDFLSNALSHIEDKTNG